MYWSRTDSLLDYTLYLLLSAAWAVGGILLASYAFRLRRLERLVGGLAAGLLLFNSLSSLLANLLPLSAAYWASALLILLAGLAASWREGIKGWIKCFTFHPSLIILAALVILFTFIQRGLALFDEYLHVPLVSTMAAGDIPPHLYVNPDLRFAYHYGIHVFAASLVRIAGFFPWSAWDISRAVAIAFTLVLGYLWVRRTTGSRLAGWLGGLLISFGGGARWLLVLLPAPWLSWLSAAVHMENTGLDTAATLAAALQRPWLIDGSGPISFPFAFHGGIFVPVTFALGSSGALPYMTVMLLLLLLPPSRRFTPLGLAAWMLIFTNLALSAEHLFAMLWLGIALAAIISLSPRTPFVRTLPLSLSPSHPLPQWLLILAASALLSAVQGGFITETLRGLGASLLGQSVSNANAYGFILRWPPGLYSAHLGQLSLFDLPQLIVLLAELGPALLLIPPILARQWSRRRRTDWFTLGLGWSALLSLLFGLLIQYGVDRSTTRMPATALWTWLVLGFPLLWQARKKMRLPARLGLDVGYIAAVLGGIVIFAFQLPAVRFTQYTYYLTDLDAGIAADYWDRLPPQAQVFDPLAFRSPAVFGRIPRAHATIYFSLPEWEALVADPDPATIAQAGFDYVYFDRRWWRNLSEAQRASFDQPCVNVMEERKELPYLGIDFRLLADISACRAGP